VGRVKTRDIRGQVKGAQRREGFGKERPAASRGNSDFLRGKGAFARG